MKQRRRDTERSTDSETAERSGIEVGAGRVESETREAKDVAAVGDRDRVRGQDLAQRGEDPIGVHVAVVAGRRARELLGVFCRAAQVLVAHAPRPSGVYRAPRGQARGHRFKRQARMRKQLHFPSPVLSQLLRIVGNADPASVWKHRRRAVAGLVIELATYRDDEVGLLHGTGAHCTNERRVRPGHEAAALLRVEIERAARIEKTLQLRRIAHRAAAGDDERPARRSDQCSRACGLLGFGRNAARRL